MEKSYVERNADVGGYRAAAKKVLRSLTALVNRLVLSDEERVRVTSREDFCDSGTLYAALRVVRDPDATPELRHIALELLLANFSETSPHLQDKRFVSSVVEFLLESESRGERPESSMEEEKERKLLRRANHALECIKSSLDEELPEDFYKLVYANLRKDIEKEKEALDENGKGKLREALGALDEYVEVASKPEKNRLLRTLNVCLRESRCGVRISVLLDFHSSSWAKKLLLCAFLSNNPTWKVDEVPQLADALEYLHERSGYRRFYIEDVLKFLINSQRGCHMDLGFVARIVRLFGACDKSLEIVYRDSCFLPTLANELDRVQLESRCRARRIKYKSEEEIAKLQSVLLYSENVVGNLVNKVKPGTEIEELIDFLETLRDNELEDKEEFLRELEPNRNIDLWKNELHLPLVRGFLLRVFPNLKRWKLCEAADLETAITDDIYYKKNKSSEPAKKEKTSYSECDEEGREMLNLTLTDETSGPKTAKMLHQLNFKLAKVLVKCGWSSKTLKTVETWIESLDEEKKLIELVLALNIISEYEMDLEAGELKTIISQSTSKNLQERVHSFTVKISFPGTYEKSLEELVKEIKILNMGTQVSLLKGDNLVEEYRKLVEAYEGTSSFAPSKKPIRSWSSGDIESWFQPFYIYNAVSMRKVLTEAIAAVSPTDIAGITRIVERCSRHEMLAVIKRAVELSSGHAPRIVQMLALILLVNNEEKKGRLAEIKTGEGKTMVIRMLAAYLALQGRRVDVLTSSKLLAIPQSSEHSGFYSMLGLKVGHNFDSSASYTFDVLYGTSNEFQGDILRDEFRKLGCRHGRGCDTAIVDEVDNMLIDGNSHIVLIGRDMPGMDNLEVLLATIYMQVKSSAASIVEIDGQTYLKEPEDALTEAGELKDEYNENLRAINMTKKEFIEAATLKYVKFLIREGDCSSLPKGYPELKVPRHLREWIVKKQLRCWVKRAMSAIFYLRNKEEYILQEDKVKIVDCDNTGVVHQNMTWSNGLHQFVEIQHGCKLSPESLTTNFISNVSYFQRYRPRILGLTGTLGTEGTRKLLARTYDVDTIAIPPFKLKQHRQLLALVTNNTEEWYKTIARSCLNKLRNGRACLVIMEYIGYIDELVKILKEVFGYEEKRIRVYKTNDDSKVVEATMDSGDIVITTNIAGRGTDIKLSKKVDEKGGLHVCVTFLPKNSRVEEQNVGRTARTGNRGTSQFILRNNEKDIRELRELRTQKEENQMKKADGEIKRITEKDRVFRRFCSLLDEIEGRNEVSRTIEKEAVEERFGLWLRMNEDDEDDGGGEAEEEGKDQAEGPLSRKFDSFREAILRDERKNRLIENPYMHVKIGNIYLKKKEYDKAISEYGLAIRLDENFGEHAYYNRGYARVAMYGSDVAKNEEEIEKAVEDWKKARALIYERENMLMLEQHASKGEVFLNKIRNKLNLYNIQKGAIDEAIGPDLKRLEAQLEDIKRREKEAELGDEEKKALEENGTYVRQQMERKGRLTKAISGGKDVRISLFGLAECLPEGEPPKHKDEIVELERNGAVGGFQVSEIPPIDWSAVIWLIALGVGQLLLGAALTVFTMGAGATIGIALIVEGISDIVTAVRDGIINRNFSWTTWAIEKAISIAVTVLCAGFSAIKDVGKTVYRGAKAAITCRSALGKEGLKLAAKKLGLELAKGGAKELSKELIRRGVDATLIPMIEEAIVDVIRGPIEKALQNDENVLAMLKLDEKNGNAFFESKIREIGRQLLTPGKNNELLAISLKIATMVGDRKIRHFSTVVQIGTAMYGIAEMTTFVLIFLSNLREGVAKVAEKEKVREKLEGQDLSKEDKGKEKEDEKAIDGGHDEKHKDDKDDVELDKIYEEHEQAKGKPVRRDPTAIAKEFVSLASRNITRIAQNKLINPGINAGVEMIGSKLTKELDATMDHQMNTYRAHRRTVITSDDYTKPKKMVERREGEAETSPEEAHKVEKAKTIIEETKKENPASLVHLGPSSEALGGPIAVYNSKGEHMYTIGAQRKGKTYKIEYHEGKNGGKIGHYTHPGGKEPLCTSDGNNSCLWDVLGEQSNQSGQEVKRKVLHTMETNVHVLAQQVNDIEHLKMYAEVRLATGGASFNPKNAEEAGQIIKKSDNKPTFGYKTVGHNDLHVPIKNTKDTMKCLAAESKKKVIIKKGGKVVKEYGTGEGEPLIFEEHGTEGDPSSIYYTEEGCPDPYNLHDPNDRIIYNVVADGINKMHADDKERKPLDANELSRKVEADLAKKPAGSFSADERMNAVANEAKKKVTIKREGKIVKEYGSSCDGQPLVLEQRGTPGDPKSEHYTLEGATRPYRINDPHNSTFFNLVTRQINKMHERDPEWKPLESDNLRDRVTTKIREIPIDPAVPCYETAVIDDPDKTAFISGPERDFVMYHVKNSPKFKKALADLNNKDTKGVGRKRQVITLGPNDYTLPRKAYATGKFMHDGTLVDGVFEIETITFLAQHHYGKQNDVDFDVYFLTSYPRPPGDVSGKVVLHMDEWGKIPQPPPNPSDPAPSS